MQNFEEFEAYLSRVDEKERRRILKTLFEKSSEGDDDVADSFPDIFRPLIQEVPEDKRSEVLQELINISFTRSEIFSGPIPPPSLMRGYEEVVPGSAERILKMAEEQSAHRRKMEGIVVPHQLKESRRGQTIAFVLALLGFATTVGLAYLGATAVAGIMAGTTIVGLVYVFVQNRRPPADATESEKSAA